MGQLENMAVFIRVVDAGGISKAAQQLNIAKSAVSRKLGELEKQLGNQLLIRTTRSSSLTSAGEHYYRRGLAILGEMADLDAQTMGIKTSLEGILRISMPHEFGLLHLNSALAEFASEHPELILQVNFNNRHVNLVEEGYELAIRIGNLEDSSLHAKPLTKIRHLIAASPQYLVKFGTPSTPQELMQHRFLQYDNLTFNITTMINSKGETIQVQPKDALKANNGIFLKDMAVKGQGIVCLPAFILQQAIVLGELVPLLTDYRFPILGAYAVYPHTRFLSLRARTLIDFLATRFSNMPDWDAQI